MDLALCFLLERSKTALVKNLTVQIFIKWRKLKLQIQVKLNWQNRFWQP